MLTPIERHELTQQFNLPEWVKQANITEPTRTDQCANGDKKYPVHTKAACYVSALRYFTKTDEQDPLTGQALVKSAEFWGIKDDIAKEAKKIREEYEKASQDVDYALPELKVLPINTAENVKIAGNILYQNRGDLPFELRRQAAKNIKKAADNFNVNFGIVEDRYIKQACGEGMVSTRYLMNELTKREYIVKGSCKDDVTAEKIAQTVETLKSLPPSVQLSEKVAQTLASIDSQFNIDSRYGSDVQLPEEACFAVLQKDAQNLYDDLIEVLPGYTYDIEDIEKVAENVVDAIPGFGNKCRSVVGRITQEKVATAIMNASQAERDLLVVLLNEQNIKPV